MQEVVNKINELVSLLEKKLDSTEVLNKQVSDTKIKLEILEAKAIAKLKNVSAMERVYKKYVDFDNEVNSFRNEKKDYSEELKLIESKKTLLAKKQKELDKLDIELTAKKKAMSVQAVKMKEREHSFDKKKDELKGLMNGQTIKDMLK